MKKNQSKSNKTFHRGTFLIHIFIRSFDKSIYQKKRISTINKEC